MDSILHIVLVDVFLQKMRCVHALFMSAKHVCGSSIVKLGKPINNFIWRRMINLFQRILHLHFECGNILIQLSDAVVFGIHQKLEILAFLLQLPKCRFPLQFTIISFFFHSNDFMMKFIVFLCYSLILPLQRNQSLCIKGLIMLNHVHLVFLELICFRCFQEVVEKSFNKWGTGNI